jgi:hypothetical protein
LQRLQQVSAHWLSCHSSMTGAWRPRDNHQAT